MAPPATPPALREQIWTAPSAQLAHDLTHAPPECIAPTDDAAERARIEAGRALFRSPTLLGGPVARVGMSCNSCHSNARVNAHFLLPELTNRAGAADVTSEWASKVRGDGLMNPRDIPDLVDVRMRASLGRLHVTSLEAFAHSVIEEEFQGPHPPDAAFADLIAYLRALDSHACAPGEAMLTLVDAANDVRRALAAAQSADDAPTASVVVLATQDAVARLVERLPEQRFARERGNLEALSRELGGVRDANAEIMPALAALAPSWSARFDAIVTGVSRHERQTYFNEQTLAAHLRR